mmetsp:Transcript_1742/g.1670  ORF Transcript_1742/g.1670 Transcript_1742/m.1670 type:complete len:88 (+) Transcript_1742:890-1153(+)
MPENMFLSHWAALGISSEEESRKIHIYTGDTNYCSNCKYMMGVQTSNEKATYSISGSSENNQIETPGKALESLEGSILLLENTTYMS